MIKFWVQKNIYIDSYSENCQTSQRICYISFQKYTLLRQIIFSNSPLKSFLWASLQVHKKILWLPRLKNQLFPWKIHTRLVVSLETYEKVFSFEMKATSISNSSRKESPRFLQKLFIFNLFQLLSIDFYNQHLTYYC